MAATVTVGFVKDAEHHIDVQGFNVYHKNRLIKVYFILFVLVFRKLQKKNNILKTYNKKNNTSLTFTVFN